MIAVRPSVIDQRWPAATRQWVATNRVTRFGVRRRAGSVGPRGGEASVSELEAGDSGRYRTSIRLEVASLTFGSSTDNTPSSTFAEMRSRSIALERVKLRV